MCDQFRYKMLSKKTWPNWKGRPKDGIREILKVAAYFHFHVANLSCGGSWVTTDVTKPL